MKITKESAFELSAFISLIIGVVLFPTRLNALVSILSIQNIIFLSIGIILGFIGLKSQYKRISKIGLILCASPFLLFLIFGLLLVLSGGYEIY